MHIALLSTYFRGAAPQHVRRLVDDLASTYDRVVVCTTPDADRQTSHVLSRPNACVRLVPNQGYDFGMWANVTRTLELDAVSSLTLVNDSCIIVQPLAEFRAYAEGRSEPIVGLIESHERQHHLQSYLITYSGSEAIRALTARLATTPLGMDYASVVNTFEVGMPDWASAHDLAWTSMFAVNPAFELNPSWYHAGRLIDLGCPLVKRRVVDLTITRDAMDRIARHGGVFGLRRTARAVARATGRSSRAAITDVLSADPSPHRHLIHAEKAYLRARLSANVRMYDDSVITRRK